MTKDKEARAEVLSIMRKLTDNEITHIGGMAQHDMSFLESYVKLERELQDEWAFLASTDIGNSKTERLNDIIQRYDALMLERKAAIKEIINLFSKDSIND